MRRVLGVLQSLRGRQGERPSWVVVGLGNPGGEYADTRHNVGFWCVDRLAGDNEIDISRRHRLARIGEGDVEGHPVVLAKPRTFVNASGEAVSYLLTRYRLSPESLLVLYDDMDLSRGKIRLRPGGGAGGHKGMQSIIDELHTRDFPRLRVGIGRPPDDVSGVDHVLGGMSEEERAKVDEAVALAVEAVAGVLNEGVEASMSRFN